MRGFSNEFTDFPDYILKITKQIWEDRGLGARMEEYYHPDCAVRTPMGVSRGEKGMTANTIETLTEFPDRTLLGEDVIWSGDPEAGMLSSHRIVSTATHAGGPWAPATGKRLVWRAMADCYAKDNQISDEWLLRDNGGLVRQLGFTPEDWVRRRLEAGQTFAPYTPERDIDGPYGGRGNDDPWGARYADLLARVMGGDFAAIGAEWDRACHLHHPGGAVGHGHAAADAFYLALRSAFPTAAFEVHHVIGRGDDDLMPPRAAVRWSLDGDHTGWGAFGAPTGKRVHVMGIGHAEFGPWGLRREWVIYDEVAAWTQILG
ncbi:MAG: ester cyclase [Shimia sp.]